MKKYIVIFHYWRSQQGKPLEISQMFEGKSRSLPYKGAPLWADPALIANVKLGCTGLSR
jgi:hypothetical protein